MEEVAFIDRRSSELTELLLVKAREELGETDEKKIECVNEIKQWINTQTNEEYSVLGNNIFKNFNSFNESRV